MTTAPEWVGTVPQWDLADRLAKSMRVADIGVSEMAEYFAVNRNTIGRYLAGRTKPSTATVRLWALRCGVPFEWLRDGDAPPAPVGPPGLEPGTYGLVVPGNARVAPLRRAA